MTRLRWYRRLLTDEERRVFGGPSHERSMKMHAPPVLQMSVTAWPDTWDDVPVVLESRDGPEELPAKRRCPGASSAQRHAYTPDPNHNGHCRFCGYKPIADPEEL